MTLPDDVVERALDAWENTAGTRRDMMRNALEAARYGELVEALEDAAGALDSVMHDDYDAFYVRTRAAFEKARALLSTIGEPTDIGVAQP